MRGIPLVVEFSQNYPLNLYGIAFVLIVAVAVVVAVAAVDLYLAFYCTPIAIVDEKKSHFIHEAIHMNAAEISTC